MPISKADGQCCTVLYEFPLSCAVCCAPSSHINGTSDTVRSPSCCSFIVAAHLQDVCFAMFGILLQDGPTAVCNQGAISKNHQEEATGDLYSETQNRCWVSCNLDGGSSPLVNHHLAVLLAISCKVGWAKLTLSLCSVAAAALHAGQGLLVSIPEHWRLPQLPARGVQDQARLIQLPVHVWDWAVQVWCMQTGEMGGCG